MNKLLFLMMLGSVGSSYAGSMNIECEAFRVSDDSNNNIQTLSINSFTAKLNRVEMDVIDGDLRDLTMAHPQSAVLKTSDGDGDINLSVEALSEITSAEGKIALGRDHEIIVYKALLVASRNGKVHKFMGTCKTELVTSCGGACGDESSDRDEL